MRLESALQFIPTSPASATDLLTGATYIIFVVTYEFYLPGDLQVLLKFSLKHNYIGSVWFNVTHKP